MDDSKSEHPREHPPPIPRLEGESGKAYDRFMYYLSLGADRSVRAVARKYAVGIASVHRQATQYRWEERALEYERGELEVRTKVRHSELAKAERKRVALEEASKDQILLEATRIALADMRQVASWDDEGLTLHNSAEISDDAAATVQEISLSFDKLGNPVKKIKLHNKLGALDKLGQYHKLWGGNQEAASAQTTNNYLVLIKAFENPRFVDALTKAVGGMANEDEIPDYEPFPPSK